MQRNCDSIDSLGLGSRVSHELLSLIFPRLFVLVESHMRIHKRISRNRLRHAKIQHKSAFLLSFSRRGQNWTRSEFFFSLSVRSKALFGNGESTRSQPFREKKRQLFPNYSLRNFFWPSFVELGRKRAEKIKRELKFFSFFHFLLRLYLFTKQTTWEKCFEQTTIRPFSAFFLFSQLKSLPSKRKEATTTKNVVDLQNTNKSINLEWSLLKHGRVGRNVTPSLVGSRRMRWNFSR